MQHLCTSPSLLQQLQQAATKPQKGRELRKHLGQNPPQAEHGMQWAHWWGMELATQLCRQQLSVSMWQVKLPSLLNTHASYHWFAQQD